MSKDLELKESTNLKIDIKTIIGFGFGLVCLVSLYFKMISETSELKLIISAMGSEQEMNSEFRIKWPRGELGALPDDAEQNIKILYLEKHQDKLLTEVNVLNLKVKELEKCNEQWN